MSIQTQQEGITEQDRTLSDLLETYRHRKNDPNVSEDRKARAAERMKSVWADLAKLQDPDGLINHISEHVQREYQRREDPPADVERRGKPLCRCDLSRHVCEAKQGEVPSKIRTQDLQYVQKPSNRTLAREYIQSHGGDVIIREAMESYRDLRADIYAELSSILVMMAGREDPDAPSDSDGGQDSHDSASEDADSEDVSSGADGGERADASAVASGGGADMDASEVVDRALASAVERHGADTLAAEATEGALSLMKVVDAYRNGEVSTEELQAVADGERSLSDLNLETETGGGDE